ncbi:MAG: PAS domain S-box protein [Salibacteraceae bacterium]
MNKDTRPYRILVFEDNPGDFLLVSDYLDEEIVSPKILHAESYWDGAVILEQDNEDIDIVLLDLSLPDKNGEELLDAVLNLSKGIPVIILTGYSDAHFAIKSLSLGASDYLLKDSLTSTVLYKSIVYNIERNNYFNQIKESKQQYSDLFHLSPQPMWVYDLQTLQFLDVNNAAIKHYGYSEEEFLSMTAKQIRPESEVPRLMESVELARKNDQLTYQSEFIHTKKNGEEIIVEATSNIIYFDGVKAEIVLCHDITERYKHILAIEKQNDKLKEIAWTQSHVVRAPLARIMGLVNLLTDGETSMEEKEQVLQYIDQSAKELDEIIQDVVRKSNQIQVIEPK